MISNLKTIGRVLRHVVTKPETVEYPDQGPDLPPRYRGRLILSRDPDGQERCVACYLCQVVCPVDCIALEATEAPDDGRRYPATFRINLSRCIFCGFCEDACPTLAIQLVPDCEMAEGRRAELVYDKEDLLVDGPGKYPDYHFWRQAGVAIAGKAKGEAEGEAAPVDPRSLVP